MKKLGLIITWVLLISTLGFAQKITVKETLTEFKLATSITHDKENMVTQKQLIKQAMHLKSYDCDPVTRSFCGFDDCALHSFCTMKIVNKKMIRKYCSQCMNGFTHEIRLCLSADCPFYKYRMGRNEE